MTRHWFAFNLHTSIFTIFTEGEDIPNSIVLTQENLIELKRLFSEVPGDYERLSKEMEWCLKRTGETMILGMRVGVLEQKTMDTRLRSLIKSVLQELYADKQQVKE